MVSICLTPIPTEFGDEPYGKEEPCIYTSGGSDRVDPFRTLMIRNPGHLPKSQFLLNSNTGGHQVDRYCTGSRQGIEGGPDG